MLKRDPEFGQLAAQRIEHGFNEHGLAVKYVDRRIGDLAMNAQRHADLGHFLEHRHDLGKVADAGMGVGGSTRGIKLHRRDQTRGMGACDIRRIGAFGQVERHQGGEIETRG